MSLRGIIINKGSTGANVENLDGCSGLLLNGVAVAASEGVLGVVLGTTYELESVKDAETLGIDAAYDSTNNVRVYRHITEFYRMAGEGTKLYICVCAQSKTPATMIADHATAMLAAANGEIRYLAIAYNPATGYTPTYVDGLEAAVREVIADAQELADAAWNSDRPLHVFVEGRGINGSAVSMLDLKEIVDVVQQYYPQVSLCIGQDWDYADALTGFAQKFADVGTCLGSKAKNPCNRNIGEVETMDISDSKKKIWLTAGLSNHTKITAAEADLETLDGKGYIFAISYTGISGYRWNNDHVCAAEVVDAEGYMNESSMALSATLNKCAREIRKAMLPKVKTTVPVDTETGYLPIGIVKYFEGIGDAALANMVAAGEISGGKTTVNQNSNLLTGNKELEVSFVAVPTGTINQIAGSINLKTSL